MNHHIAIGTEDPESLAAFYERIPGWERETTHLEKNSREVRSVWMKKGDLRIMLEKGVAQAPRALVFRWEETERPLWEEFFEEVPWRDKTDFTVYFEDKEGNKLGVSSYPEKHKILPKDK